MSKTNPAAMTATKKPAAQKAAPKAATKAAPKTVVHVSCTVIAPRAKIRGVHCGKGKSLSLPVDEVKALVELKLVKAG